MVGVVLKGKFGCETCEGIGTHPLNHETPCPECKKEQVMVCYVEASCVSSAFAMASCPSNRSATPKSDRSTMEYRLTVERVR